MTISFYSPRFQFSLLALLILITVVAAFLAGRASLIRELREAQARVDQLQQSLDESYELSRQAVADSLILQSQPRPQE
jgi:hypothetical protein